MQLLRDATIWEPFMSGLENNLKLWQNRPLLARRHTKKSYLNQNGSDCDQQSLLSDVQELCLRSCCSPFHVVLSSWSLLSFFFSLFYVRPWRGCPHAVLINCDSRPRDKPLHLKIKLPTVQHLALMSLFPKPQQFHHVFLLFFPPSTSPQSVSNGGWQMSILIAS